MIAQSTSAKVCNLGSEDDALEWCTDLEAWNIDKCTTTGASLITVDSGPNPMLQYRTQLLLSETISENQRRSRSLLVMTQ